MLLYNLTVYNIYNQVDYDQAREYLNEQNIIKTNIQRGEQCANIKQLVQETLHGRRAAGQAAEPTALLIL